MEVKNRLYCGDCKEVLNKLIEENLKVDLIYLDPPFNSNAVYNLTYRNPNNKSAAQQKAFYDMWTPTYQTQLVLEEFVEDLKYNKFIEDSVKDFLIVWMEALSKGSSSNKKLLNYLLYMTERLILMKGVLKDTGSIYLHCDPTASHYLKVIMDGIFGSNNFRNEIVWQRTTAHNDANRYGSIHDLLLFYSKSSNYIWNNIKQPYEEDYIKTYFKYEDARGKYWKENLTGPKISKGDSGKTWRGYNPSSFGRSWAVPKKVVSKLNIEHLSLLDKLEFMYQNNYIEFSKNGTPTYKRYLQDQEGKAIQDIWTDIKPLGGFGHKKQERENYPTQKPKALLERIIQASCSKDGIVLDPFCGCGTTLDAAISLKRNWIGIDISAFAIDIIENRIKDAGLNEKNYTKHIIRPQTWDEYQKLDPYQKQDFLISTLGGIPNQKKSGDKGIDGELTVHLGLTKNKEDIWGKVIFSVKTGKQCNPAMIRELKGTMQASNAAIGVLILDEDPSFNMLEEVEKSKKITHQLDASLPPQEFNSIQIYTANQILNGVILNAPPSIAKVKQYRKIQGELFNH